jgi:hypothetical protein
MDMINQASSEEGLHMLRIGRSMTIVCALLSIGRLAAQVNATGTFSGQVTDPGGAGVPNAAVKVTEENTGVSVSRTTGSDGYYTISLLKPGVYTIEVAAPGFSTEVAKGLTLQIQQVAQQDFKLQVGGIQQTVNVEGTAPLLNTESTEVGNVITQTSIEQLPLNGRNFSQLALLVPGTTPGPVGGIRQTGGGNETKRDGAEITTSGGRGSTWTSNYNLYQHTLGRAGNDGRSGLEISASKCALKHTNCLVWT